MNMIVYFLFSAIVLLFPMSSNAGIGTIEDFNNSQFLKKYKQTKPVSSWPLKKGGVNHSYSFGLGRDEYSWFSVGIVTVGKIDSRINWIGLSFHDESNQNITPTRFTNNIKQITNDCLKYVDSTIDLNIADRFIGNEAKKKRRVITDAPLKSFGKYSIRAGTVLHELIIIVESNEQSFE